MLPGLAVGSFLNVVAARLPERRSLVHPRSACRVVLGHRSPGTTTSRCSATSLLRGRCRTCRTSDRPVYPAGRARNGGAARRPASSRSGSRSQAAAAAVFCAALVVVTATDLDPPDRPEPRSSCRPRRRARADDGGRAEPGVGDRRRSAQPAFLLVAALAYPGGMGMGDVKLALLMGVRSGARCRWRSRSG